MEDIRQALIKGDQKKLSKKEYKFAVKLEKQRLRQQLIFLTIVSFVVGLILFVSLYPEMNQIKKIDYSEGQFDKAVESQTQK